MIESKMLEDRKGTKLLKADSNPLILEHALKSFETVLVGMHRDYLLEETCKKAATGLQECMFKLSAATDENGELNEDKMELFDVWLDDINMEHIFMNTYGYIHIELTSQFSPYLLPIPDVASLKQQLREFTDGFKLILEDQEKGLEELKRLYTKYAYLDAGEVKDYFYSYIENNCVNPNNYFIAEKGDTLDICLRIDVQQYNIMYEHTMEEYEEYIDTGKCLQTDHDGIFKVLTTPGGKRTIFLQVDKDQRFFSLDSVGGNDTARILETIISPVDNSNDPYKDQYDEEDY